MKPDPEDTLTAEQLDFFIKGTWPCAAGESARRDILRDRVRRVLGEMRREDEAAANRNEHPPTGDTP